MSEDAGVRRLLAAGCWPPAIVYGDMSHEDKSRLERLRVIVDRGRDVPGIALETAEPLRDVAARQPRLWNYRADSPSLESVPHTA